MENHLPTFDLSKKDGLSQFVPSTSSISSHAAGWEGFHLEFHKVSPFEVPECVCEQHIITIPTINGLKVERIVEGKKEDVIFHPGDFCFSPEGISLQTRWHQDLEAIHLILEPDLIAQVAYELIDPDQVAFHCHTKVADPLVYQLALTLKRELETFGHDSKLYAASAATFLAIHLLKKYAIRKPKMKTNPGGLSPIQLRRATDYIYAHLAEGINLDTLSSHLGLSRYYFCRLFKHSTGFSPYQYVIRCRVERAKELLKRGGLTLGEVALACGFSHQSHLYRHFKRVTGVTPKSFVNS